MGHLYHYSLWVRYTVIPLISILFLSPSRRPLFIGAGIVFLCPLQFRETCFDGVDFPPALEISGCFHFPEEGLTLCLLDCGGFRLHVKP